MKLRVVDPFLWSVAITGTVLHDIGKVPFPFQDYLKGKSSWSPHEIYGAKYVWDKAEKMCLVEAEIESLIWLVAEHHSGFARRWQDLREILKRDLKSSPYPKFGNKQDRDLRENLYADLVNQVSTWVETQPFLQDALDLFRRLKAPIPENKWERFVKLRMAMGVLKRSDCIDTARAFGTGDPTDDLAMAENLVEVCDRAKNDLAKKSKKAAMCAPNNTLALLRENLYRAACVAPPPDARILLIGSVTGSGKTSAGLRLAAAMNAKRIVYALPYLSIADQTSALLSEVYRMPILEHVSVPSSETRLGGDAFKYQDTLDRSHLPDWNCPFIVTTTERLSRVLVGKSNMDARRLLSLSSSETVVIIDEAHSIPLHKLYVYLNLLVAAGCRVILMSATMPAIRKVLPKASFHDVVPDTISFKPPSLRRFEWQYGGPSLADHERVLSIYNTKRQAHDAFQTIKHLPNSYVLTTNLCASHRRRIVSAIRGHLERKEPVRVASTQVVEAGVDIDFPVVFRQLAPLYAVLQSAGRCNREGLIPEGGKMTVWVPRNRDKSNMDVGDEGDYARQAEALWAVVKSLPEKPSTDEEMAALAPIVAKDELRILKTENEIEKIDNDFQHRRFDRTCKLTLIPPDGNVQVLVDYDEALRRIRNGEMRRQEMPQFCVDLPPESDPRIRMERVRFADDTNADGSPKSVCVHALDGHYDPIEGVDFNR